MAAFHAESVRPVNAALDPSVAASLAAIDAELLKREAEELKGSLHVFVRRFWHVIEPKRPFADNWHIHTICEHLEAVTRGEIENLIINVPPGTSKSTLVSVMWPAWEWASDPTLRIFGASYGEPLAIRDAMLSRAIILSPDYQALFPGVTIQKGSDEKRKFNLTSGGWRMATSVGGRGTGEHPDRKIVDDPHNVKQSESDTQRQEALEWHDGTISSRGVGDGSREVVIMQRLHAKDLTGHIMLSEDYASWAHLVIPMAYEPKRLISVSPLGFKDPRKKEGDLLWPERFTAVKVKKLAGTLGSYRAAGQLQQRPAPEGGGILQPEYFQLWLHKQLPDIHYIIQSYDTAFTEETENDPTACTTWGLFYTGETKNFLLLDAWDEHLEFPELNKKMMADWKAEYGGVKDDPTHPSHKADMVLVEDKGSGISIVQALRRRNIPVKAYNPGRASKTQRAHMASSVLEAKVLWVLGSRKEAGKPITWARPLLAQCEEFPNGEHDDYVDTLTQFCIYAEHADLVSLEAVEDAPQEDEDYDAKKRSRRNPYS